MVYAAIFYSDTSPTYAVQYRLDTLPFLKLHDIVVPAGSVTLMPNSYASAPSFFMIFLALLFFMPTFIPHNVLFLSVVFM